MVTISDYGMSINMYNFINNNINKLKYDLENGLVITPRGTNGTLDKSNGYLRVKVSGKSLQVHQILSVIYFGEKCIGMQINNKDGNKLNNKKSNLEAITMLENIKHEYDTGLAVPAKPTNMVVVDKLDLDGNYICTYSSMKEASVDVGLKTSTPILHVLKGRRNKAGGFKWRYSS